MTDHLLAEFFSHSAVDEAMQDAWNDICSDTGCHPLDIEHGKGKQLTFRPSHWANQVAKRLFVRAVKVQLKSDADRETCATCMGSGYSNHPDSGQVCEACAGQGGSVTRPNSTSGE